MFLAMSAIAYFQQKGVTIAAERIMPELSLSQMQIGWIQWAFLLAYTPSQVFSGLVGQRFGARLTLAVAGAVALLTASLRWWAGVMVALYAVCVFPANIKHAFENVLREGFLP